MHRLTCEACSAAIEVRGGSVRAQAACPCCGAPLAQPKQDAPVQFPAFSEGRWYRCPQCSAETFFDPRLAPLSCSLCGSAKLLPVPDLTGTFEEHYYLPFLINPDNARQRVQRFLGAHLWIPGEVRKQLRSATPEPHYIPTCQLSCSVRTSIARPGDDLPADDDDDALPLDPLPDSTDSKIVQPKPVSGLTSVAHRFNRLLDVLKPSEPMSANDAEDSHSGYYNERVPNSRGVAGEIVQRLLPFNYRLLRPFRPAALGSAKLERPAESDDLCWEKATERVCDSEMKFFQKQRGARTAAEGDEDPQVRIVFVDRKARLVLLPMYVVGYHYQGRYHRLLINGQTGKVVEVLHLSPARMAAIAGGFAVAVLVLLLALLSSDFGAAEEARRVAARRAEVLGAIPLHLQVTPNATFGSLISDRESVDLEPGRVLRKNWTVGQDPLGELVRAGETQASTGSLDRAREAFEQLIRRFPEDPRALYHWARFKLAQGEAQDAETPLAGLLARFPAFNRGYEVLADCKRRLGKWSEAVAAYEQAHERSSPDPFTTFDAADLCRVFLNDPARTERLYRLFLVTPESGPAYEMIRFLLHQLDASQEQYFADTVYLKAGGSLRGRLLSRAAGVVRLKLLTGRSSGEVDYAEDKIARIEHEPLTIKVEFDQVLNEYDRLLLERKAILTKDDYLALARLCQGMSDLRVKEAGRFFALRLAILDPENEEAAKILDAGGYSVSRARLVRKPVLDQRRGRDERY